MASQRVERWVGTRVETKDQQRVERSVARRVETKVVPWAGSSAEWSAEQRVEMRESTMVGKWVDWRVAK